MNVVDETKHIIFNFIESEYQDYLHNNKILLIKEKVINNVITDFYENNNKKLKNLIRSKLKEKYKEKYPSASVENIILDIFQDKKSNIQKTIEELLFIQKKNFNNVNIPIINNSLNLNIALIDSYIVINSCNSKNITKEEALASYKIVNNYKFLYSIENIILEEIEDNEKINTIKEILKNKETPYINIGLYYLKNNQANEDNKNNENNENNNENNEKIE